jgi:hypothetical protein
VFKIIPRHAFLTLKNNKHYSKKKWQGAGNKLQNEDLHGLYSTNFIRVIKSRRMKLVRHAARMGEMTNAYNILVGKHLRKRQLGRPRRRWEDNIKMNLKNNNC